ncbi:PREDICTED: homeobox protein ceh-1 [Nicrophorus vespilloides]|uniref:Homeobox protein ceh-1 n=1 Tax=Nicrophorus vespilloides TaxID=110193 RepID=A0ABM1MDS7_NICVS|nr:PREDICTED: homeobox protein ceh-1 [Nicrophorus vespilloides]
MYQQQYKSGVSSYNNSMQKQGYYNRIPCPSTSTVLNKLEEAFKKTQLISITDLYNLALELNLQEKQINIWFQNRIMKEKKQKIRVAATIATAGKNSPSMISPTNQYVTQGLSPTASYFFNSNSLVYQSNVLQSSTSNFPEQQIPYQYINLPGPSPSYTP